MKKTPKPTNPIAAMESLLRLPVLQPSLPRMNELFQGCLRVGSTPQEAFNWLLQFCKTDLTKLSEGDWKNLQYEIEWFGIWGPPNSAWGFPSNKSLAPTTFDPNTPPPDQGTIQALHQFAKTHLDEFIERGETSITLEPSSALCVKRDWKKATAEFRLQPSNIQQGFAFSLAQILRMEGARLTQCSECEEYFSARSNQIYCSSRCQNRVSLKTFREKSKPAPKNSKTRSRRKKKSKQ